MSRHGQCRCGEMLTFRRRDGYKARCPKCGKVVKVQPDSPTNAPVAVTDIPSAFDAAELDEPHPEAETAALVEDRAAALEPPWTWQWYAVGGGLIAWVGVLSILAWLWWQ